MSEVDDLLEGENARADMVEATRGARRAILVYADDEDDWRIVFLGMSIKDLALSQVLVGQELKGHLDSQKFGDDDA